MSTFAAQFAQRLLDNFQTRLEANANTQVAAVDAALALFATETDAHAQKVGFNTPTPITTNFPALYLEPSASNLSQSSDDSHIEQTHELALNLALAGPDANTLKSQIVKYVTALDRCIRQMTDAQITGGITSAIRKPVLEITEHRYGVLRVAQEGTIYRRDAQLIIVVQILEK